MSKWSDSIIAQSSQDFKQIFAISTFFWCMISIAFEKVSCSSCLCCCWLSQTLHHHWGHSQHLEINLYHTSFKCQSQLRLRYFSQQRGIKGTTRPLVQSVPKLGVGSSIQLESKSENSFLFPSKRLKGVCSLVRAEYIVWELPTVDLGV